MNHINAKNTLDYLWAEVEACEAEVRRCVAALKAVGDEFAPELHQDLTIAKAEWEMARAEFSDMVREVRYPWATELAEV